MCYHCERASDSGEDNSSWNSSPQQIRDLRLRVWSWTLHRKLLINFILHKRLTCFVVIWTNKSQKSSTEFALSLFPCSSALNLLLQWLTSCLSLLLVMTRNEATTTVRGGSPVLGYPLMTDAQPPPLPMPALDFIEDDDLRPRRWQLLKTPLSILKSYLDKNVPPRLLSPSWPLGLGDCINKKRTLPWHAV